MADHGPGGGRVQREHQPGLDLPDLAERHRRPHRRARAGHRPAAAGGVRPARRRQAAGHPADRAAAERGLPDLRGRAVPRVPRRRRLALRRRRRRRGARGLPGQPGRSDRRRRGARGLPAQQLRRAAARERLLRGLRQAGQLEHAGRCQPLAAAGGRRADPGRHRHAALDARDRRPARRPAAAGRRPRRLAALRVHRYRGHHLRAERQAGVQRRHAVQRVRHRRACAADAGAARGCAAGLRQPHQRRQPDHGAARGHSAC